MSFHVDSFSGAVADLPKGRRTSMDVLAVLATYPRVSTFDMSDLRWLRDAVAGLEREGLVVRSLQDGFPWVRYTPTESGLAKLRSE